MKKKRLTKEQQQSIWADLNAGIPVADLSEKYKVSKPTIYNLKKKSDHRPQSTVAVIKERIAAARNRIQELERYQVEIQSLQKEIQIMEGTDSWTKQQP